MSNGEGEWEWEWEWGREWVVVTSLSRGGRMNEDVSKIETITKRISKKKCTQERKENTLTHTYLFRMELHVAWVVTWKAVCVCVCVYCHIAYMNMLDVSRLFVCLDVVEQVFTSTHSAHKHITTWAMRTMFHRNRLCRFIFKRYLHIFGILKRLNWVSFVCK